MSLFSLCFQDLSIDQSRVSKSPTIIVTGSVHALRFNEVSFTNEVAVAFGT